MAAHSPTASPTLFSGKSGQIRRTGRSATAPTANVTVPPATRVVVTEGNYLLDVDDPWPHARSLMAEVWFVELDENRRRSRLVERHVASGKDRSAAQAWVDDVDEPNAQRVRDRRSSADLVVATD